MVLNNKAERCRGGGTSQGKRHEMRCHHLHPNRIPLIASIGVDVASSKIQLQSPYQQEVSDHFI